MNADVLCDQEAAAKTRAAFLRDEVNRLTAAADWCSTYAAALTVIVYTGSVEPSVCSSAIDR